MSPKTSLAPYPRDLKFSMGTLQKLRNNCYRMEFRYSSKENTRRDASRSVIYTSNHLFHTKHSRPKFLSSGNLSLDKTKCAAWYISICGRKNYCKLLQIEFFHGRKVVTRHGGGVSMYVHESLMFDFRNDFNVAELESLTIEIRLPFTKPIILMTFYRPVGPVEVYNDIQNLVSNILFKTRNSSWWVM